MAAGVEPENSAPAALDSHFTVPNKHEIHSMTSQFKISFGALAVAIILLATSPSLAQVTEYFYEEEWEAAVGDYITIDFTGFSDSTIITTQYESLGVTFTDGNDFIACCGDDSFPIDGAGLMSSGIDDTITLIFDAPQNWIATNHPGVLVMQLYSGGQLIHDSSPFGGSGAGHFGGLASIAGFDKVVLYDPLNSFAIDNMRFGAVPAPGVMIVLAMGVAQNRRRCRS